MLFETRRHRMRRERYEAGFRPEWRELLAARLQHWNRLSPAERDRLEALALGLIAEKSWEPASGFELTDEIMVLIASQAALIVLGLPDDSYRDLDLDEGRDYGLDGSEDDNARQTSKPSPAEPSARPGRRR